METTTRNMAGRPPLTQEDIDNIFRKLEPYLKTGLSINKASLSAHIPKSTVYDLYARNSQFAERVDTSQNYISVITGGIITSELSRIFRKQAQLQSNSQTPILMTDEIKFVQWVAQNSRRTYEEYGKVTEEFECPKCKANGEYRKSFAKDPRNAEAIIGSCVDIARKSGYRVEKIEETPKTETNLSPSTQTP